MGVRRSLAARRILIAGVVVALIAAAALVAGPAGKASAAATLLSQGKPATASSTENATFPASNAVDGNTSTRWSSAFSDPQWLEVDLGASASISQVVLQWEAAYGSAFQIQTSPDGSAWTSIYSTTTGTGGTQTLNVTGTGRYIRMYGTARATQYGYSLWEFGVYTTGGGGNTVTVTSPGSQSSTVGTAVSLQIHATDSGSGQTLAYSATGLPAGMSISSTSGLISGTPTTARTPSVTVTARDTTRASGSASFSWTVSASGGSCPAQSNTPNFGPNVDIFDPGMSSASIQSTLDSVFNAQKLNQFGTQRYALLFKPGTVAAAPTSRRASRRRLPPWRTPHSRQRTRLTATPGPAGRVRSAIRNGCRSIWARRTTSAM